MNFFVTFRFMTCRLWIFLEAAAGGPSRTFVRSNPRPLRATSRLARRVVACREVRRDLGRVQDVVVRSVRLSDHIHLLSEGIAVSASFRNCPSDHVSTRSLLPPSSQCPIQLDQAAEFVTSCTCE